MDKSWMKINDRSHPKWQEGMVRFLDMAFKEVGKVTIRCPCRECNNANFLTRERVQLHLCRYGMQENCITWIHHGEETLDDLHATDDTRQERTDDAAYEMVNDILRGQKFRSSGDFSVSNDMCDEVHMQDSQEPNEDAQKIFNVLKDAQQPLFPGCKTLTKLTFIVRVFQMKCLHGLTEKAIDAIFDLFKLALSENHNVPDSLYSAKKIARGLGLSYEKIDACANDCVLYRNYYSDLRRCPVCMEPRWKSLEKDDAIGSSKKEKKVSRKILRYFPLMPRLQRLFMHKSTSCSMRWHKEGRADDGILRHPADALAWKHFDQQYPSFDKKIYYCNKKFSNLRLDCILELQR